MMKFKFSYTTMASTPVKRLFILLVEMLSGRRHLEKIYLAIGDNPTKSSFWNDAILSLQLDLQFSEEKLLLAPKTGPLIIVSNHPYGVLDGLSISCVIEKIRPDFKLLASSVLSHIPEIVPFLLPIDLSDRQEAIEHNINTRQETLRHLQNGGAVIVFPAGLISKTPTIFSKKMAIDPAWGTFTSKLIKRSQAAVLPIFFEGQNSRFFHIVSHISRTFRLALIFHEVKIRMGTPVKILVGDVIQYHDIADMNHYQLIEKLRQDTYALDNSS